jgi:hypothetical protein
MPCNAAGNSPTLSISIPSTTICAQSNLDTLTAHGANTYTWNTSATTATIIPYSGNPGPSPYSVAGTNTLTGCTTTVSINLTVTPSPNVLLSSSAPSVCVGHNVTLSAFGTTATYTWSQGGSGATSNVSPTVTTTYTVTGTNSYGCSQSAAASITVYPLPAITLSASGHTLCANENLTLTAGGASTYTWIAPGGALNMSNPFQTNNPLNGSYSVTGTDANGCTNSAAISVMVSACTGLDEHTGVANVIRIYPNPGNSKITLEWQKALSLKNQITVSNSLGQVIYSIENYTNTSLELNLTEYSQGVYFLNVYDNGTPNVYKVIKQ